MFLVTGRMRPLDRDDLDADLGPLVSAGPRTRRGCAAPVIVVSTQCIEAGADFDFDTIVTECASLDALRQRFGRLNRLGDHHRRARGRCWCAPTRWAKDAEDPIYGQTLAATWQWLSEGARDFGILAMAQGLPEGDALAQLLSPKDRAPVMLPAHLDLWSQTKPTPRPDPDVSLWLHGVDQKQEPEVQIVWRADLSEAQFTNATSDDASLDALLAQIEVCAPLGLEALSLPLHAARAWLRREATVEVADVEGERAKEEGRPEKKPKAGRPALLWRGDESRIIDPAQLPPGATVVVPSTYGGLRDGAWDPSSETPVLDLGDRARWQQTRRPTLRLHPAVVDSRWPTVPARVNEEEGSDTETRDAVMGWLSEVKAMSNAASPLFGAFAALLAKGRNRPALIRLGAPAPGAEKEDEPRATSYFALVGRSRVQEDEGGDGTTEDDGASASLTGTEVTLTAHMKGVAEWAREFGDHCGLPSAIVRDVELAGRWHDAGKVDRRFQRMLHGGSEYRASVATEPLAKSAIVAADRAARIRAFERSGYPRGARHELASIALLEAHSSLLAAAGDRELVLHLVASHHGWCRPFAPVVPDPEPVPLVLDVGDGVPPVSSDHGLARLDSGIADRFFRLTTRYGWFGLAWLEAILRLADHRRSEEEQHTKEAP